MRNTYSLRCVAEALLEEPNRKHWGYDLMKRTGQHSGVVYPILRRLVHEKWLTVELSDEWRFYYKLTKLGREHLAGLLEEVKR